MSRVIALGSGALSGCVFGYRCTDMRSLIPSSATGQGSRFPNLEMLLSALGSLAIKSAKHPVHKMFPTWACQSLNTHLLSQPHISAGRGLEYAYLIHQITFLGMFRPQRSQPPECQAQGGRCGQPAPRIFPQQPPDHARRFVLLLECYVVLHRPLPDRGTRNNYESPENREEGGTALASE